MVQQWEPGTQYDYDSVVIYEGVAYKIIQPHRSQGDWAPPNTPALWGRMQDQSCAGGGGHHGGHHHGGEGQQWQQQQQQQQQQQPPQQQQFQYGSGGQGGDSAAAQPTEQEKKTNWYDLDDERKKQLELGGGLLAGAGLLAGGFAAFNSHKKGKEDQKADAWAMSNWLQDAQSRAAAFHRTGPQGPYTWVLTHGKDIPRGAIVGGQEDNTDDKILYIARAYYEGGVHLGKAGRHLQKGAVIGYGGKEIEIDTYEVLLGDNSKCKWVAKSDNNFSPQAAVEGGREADGTPLLVAQAFYKGGTQPGKYSDKLGGACIAYGGKEEVIKKDYRILIVQ